MPFSFVVSLSVLGATDELLEQSSFLFLSESILLKTSFAANASSFNLSASYLAFSAASTAYYFNFSASYLAFSAASTAYYFNFSASYLAFSAASTAYSAFYLVLSILSIIH